MSIYSTVISTIATSSGGGTSTFIISNITGVYPVGITNDTDAFTSGGLVFSGSNMTIGTSVDGSTNYIQMTAGIGGMAASAGTELVSSGTMIFSNSNGISFGFNASTLTASHNAFSNTSQLTNYLAPKTHIHGSVSLDLLNMSGATASASDGLTLSLTGPPGVISLNGASGQLTFNEGSFINISQNIRSFTINVSNTSAITSAAFPSANTTKFAGSGTTTVSTAGSDLKLTLNSQGLNLGVPAWLTTAATGGGGGAALQGSGTYTQNSGTIQFANSNSMTFGLTENQMTASFSYTQSTHEHPYLGSGESTYYQTSNLSSVFLTTAALSNHSHTQYLTTALETNYTSHTHDYQSTGNYLTTALGTSYTSHTHSQYLTTAMVSQNTSLFVYTSASSLLQHTSATSAITSNALNTSVSGSFQLTANNSLSLGTGYTTHTHEYQSTGNYLTTALATNYTSHTHSQYLTTAALSNHTHSDLYIAKGDSTAYQTSVLSGTFLQTGYTTHTHNYQSTGAYLTTAMLSNMTSVFEYTSHTSAITASALNTSQSSLFQHTSATSAITSNAVNTSVTSAYQLIANSTLSLGTAYTSHTHSNLYIALANSTAYATSVLSNTFQTTGAYLTTAALSNHTHSNLYIALGDSTYYQSSNLSSVFQTTGAYITTAMASDAGSNYAGVGLSTETTSGDDLAITFNSSGLSLGIPAWITTGVAGGGVAIAGSGSTETDGTVIFSASNGITFGLSDYTMTASIANNIGSLGFNDSNGVSFGVASTTSNSSTVVTASIAAYIGTATTITTTTGTNLLVTAGTAGLNIAHPDWLTTYTPGAGGGEWTVLSTNAGTDIIISTASDTNTLYHPAFITTYSPGCGAVDWSVSSTAGTDVVISTATDTITFYQPPFITGYTESTHDFTQYVGLTSTAITGGSATIASDRLLINIPSNAGSLGYNDSNGVTFGVASTTSNSSTVVTASIAAYAGTSLSTVSTTGSVLLGGINTAGISLSVPAWLTTAAGGGGVAVIASDATYTSGSVSFRGTNVTINTSAGGQYVDLSVAAPATSSAYTYMQWHNFTGNSTHVAPGQNTIWYSPFELMSPVSASSIQIGMTFNGTSTSDATAQWGLTQDLMLMARHSTDSTRFDSIWSSRNLITLWISGTSSGSLAFNAGTSSSNGSRLVGSYFYGQRIISAAVGSELSKGFYMFAYRQSFSTAAYSALVRSCNPVFVGPLYKAKNFLGAQTNISVGHFPGGRYSVTSAAFPTSIGVSELLKSNDLNVFFVIGASS